jgi:hypothetical protein
MKHLLQNGHPSRMILCRFGFHEARIPSPDGAEWSPKYTIEFKPHRALKSRLVGC